MKLHLAELSRRGVFKTLVAYAVAAWVLTEVTSVIGPAFLLPDWTVAAVTTVVVLGAFPVLLLSWRYDFTLEGIERDTRRLSKPAERSAKTISALIVILLLSATAMLWMNYFRAQTTNEANSLLLAQQGAPKIGADGQIRSIAVLPFDDYSPGGGRGLLADGIAEAVLHVLAQNKELVVTSRKSSFMFRDKDVSAAEIGRILNVQVLLEGSIQIVNDQLRVTSQLIRTSDQAHIWSNVYEAPLDDLFRVNDEIAIEVRDLILPQRMSPPGPAGHAHPPSVEAWQLLLEARELIGDLESTERAIRLINVVIELWPDYAAAHAWLAMALNNKARALRSSHTASYTEVKLVREESIEKAEFALELDPDNHLALLIKGRESAKDGARGYHEAIETVLELAPNDPSVLHWLAGLANFTGDFGSGAALLARARAVDPGDYDVLDSYLHSICGAQPLIPIVETQLQDYPASRVRTLNLRSLALICDRQPAESISTTIKLARIDDKPDSSFRALIQLAVLGHEEALALVAGAHRLMPREFNGTVDGVFTPAYFTQILSESLETYNGHMNSEFASREGTRIMYAIALMMAGDYANAEKNIDAVKYLLDSFYASVGERFWQVNTISIYAFKAWFLAQRGETDQARAIAEELLQDLDEKNVAHWSGSRGRLDDLPLMILLLNDRRQQAVDWLLDAERDRWLLFQAVLTSPVYAEFREITEVAQSLARMADWRAGVLDVLMAAGLPEVQEPSLLLDMMQPLVTHTHHERAQIALHFHDDPAGALLHYERALAQEPDNLAIINQVAALAQEFGLVDEAVLLYERAVSLSPADASAHYFLAFAYACAQRPDDAIASARKAVELSPESPVAQRLVGMTLILKGEPLAAMEVMQQIQDESNRSMGLVLAHCALEQKTEADALLAQWIGFGGAGNPFHLAYSLAYCGESDLAFDWLDNAATVGPQVTSAAVHPFLSRLYDDPRWPPFLEGIGKSPDRLAGIEFNVPYDE